jgi:hypothetical protein
LNQPRPRRSARSLTIALLVALVGLLLSMPFVGRRGMVPPALDTAEIVVEEIHRGIDRGRRLPAEVALPHLARAGLLPFIAQLPLREDVRARVRARVRSEGFVDDLVPFLLFLKSTYVTTHEMRGRDFDATLRRRIDPAEALPGMEHELFRWVPEPGSADQEHEAEGENGGGFGVDQELIAELLNFYDALYLVDHDPDAPISDRLACGSDQIEARMTAAAGRAEEPLRRLLERVLAQLEPGSEMASALAGILSDPERMETIGLTVVQFIEQTICKHAQMLSTTVARERELKAFLLSELDEPRGGRLWAYLEYAQRARRYGAMIVVDGLQGHLVEALAAGDAGSPFIRQVVLEQRAGTAAMRPASGEGPDLSQQTDFLEAFAASGFSHPAYLPFFRDLYDDAGPDDPIAPLGIARSGISTTPTISVRNLPLVLTGSPVAGPGGTGIPNFHFVDRDYRRDGVRQGRAYYFFGNDALQLTALTERAGMKSLFEQLAARSSYSCGAQYDEWAHAGIDPFFNLAIGEAARDFGERLCFSQLERRAERERESRADRRSLLELRDRLGREVPFYDWYGLWEQRTGRLRARQLIERIGELESEPFPELLVYYNPWPDHFAHFTGPFSDEILSPSGELARLDYWLERLTGLYRDAGVFDRTLFGLAGDHGLGPVFRLESPRARVLDPMEARGVPLRVIKISSDEGEGPKLTHALEPPSMRGYDVVIASTAGGNLMLDLFVDQGARWHIQPLESDLRAWQPIAWQGESEEGSAPRRIDLIFELISGLGDTLDYLVVRTEPCDVDGGAVRVLGPAGEAVVTRRGDLIHYQAIVGDPLETERASPYEDLDDEAKQRHLELLDRCRSRAAITDSDTWCNESEWRQLARHTPRPDSVVQIAHLYDLDRAGTVNLFPAPGVGYNSVVPGRHAGESFHEKDAFVGVFGAPLEHAGSRPEAAVGRSAPRAILEYLRGGAGLLREPGWEESRGGEDDSARPPAS